MNTKDCVYRYRHIKKDVIFKYTISENKDICYATGKIIPYKQDCKNCKIYVSRYKERTV